MAEIKLVEGRIRGPLAGVELTLQKNTAASIKLPSNYGHMLIASQSAGLHGCIWFRGGLLATEFGGSWKLHTVPLTGVTGEDLFLNFSAAANVLYIEERRASPTPFSITFTG